jgi:membrane protein DedA with SNARE-associated domain
VHVISVIGDWLKILSEALPLEWFTVVGGFVEELIGPIPSPLVLTLAGSIAADRQSGFWYVILLALLASGGKTAASWLLYLLGDKAEYWIVGKWGEVLGLSHEKVRSWSASFNGGWWDDALIIFLRAVPILPAAPISVLCGVLKIKMRTYLVSTFIGYALRSLFFLWVGYAGTDAYKAIADDIDASEALLTVGIILASVGLLVWLYYAQRRKKWWRKAWERILEAMRRLMRRV